MLFRIGIVLIAVLIMAGCTPKNKVTQDVPPPQAPSEFEVRPEAVPDTLDYNFLREQSLGFPDENPALEADLPVLDDASDNDGPIWTLPEDKPVPRAAEGLFWVQIFASRNQDRAEQIAGEAEDRLSHSIEIHYLEPYYKVLVGGFAEREEAVDLRDRLVSKGYRDAWIFEL